MQWFRRLTGQSTRKESIPNLNPVQLSAFKLVGYISLTAGACADAILDKWPSLAGKAAGPSVSYFVYSQFLFLYLHLMDRMAFAQGGDHYRVAVREAVTPQLIPALNGYLSGRHHPSQRVSSSELDSIADDFFEMLDQSEFSFSRLRDYESMVGDVIERLNGAWELNDAKTLAETAQQEAGTRGHNLKPLVSEVIRQLEIVT